MKTYADLTKDITDLPVGTWRLLDHESDVVTGNHSGQTLLSVNGQWVAVVWCCDWAWDHVRVSLKKRTPNYQEMKWVKRMFFKPDEWAMELHPPHDDYVSINDNVLHLWRPHDVEIPQPPKGKRHDY